MTKYYLKLSADGKALYGTTAGMQMSEPGLFYSRVIKKSKGAKTFNTVTNSVK